MAARPIQVAIVGMGPRGLYALERLLARIEERPTGAPVAITAFEPHPEPGAGPVYDPTQPPYLRMNFAAELVDMWWREGGAGDSPERPSFVRWRADGGVGSAEERYPPRAEVGAYLVDGLARLRAGLPPGVSFEVVAAEVRRVERCGDAWFVTAAGEPDGRFDEVLLTTGHLPARDPSDDRDERGSSRDPDGPGGGFPFESGVLASVPPGGAVAVRGFALTFVDTALALTEGRGGRFERSFGEAPLRYLSSGREPATILPFSRTGRPMLAKPSPHLAGAMTGHDRLVETARRALAGAPAPVSLERTLVPALRSLAEELLAAVGGPAETVPAELDSLLAPESERLPDAGAVRARIGRSLGIATGRERPDAPWMLAEAWRSLYPAIVERFGAASLPPGEWSALRRLEAEMERLAFGPPVVNAEKLLALIDTGIVDLSHVAGGAVVGEGRARELRSPAGSTPVDAVLDAVSPPPGAEHLRHGVLGALRAGGLVHVPAGRRGIEIGADGTCVGESGEPTRGLAALGRVTEDWVIGNDTLSRTLHPHPDRWAVGVIDRARRRSASPPASGADEPEPVGALP